MPSKLLCGFKILILNFMWKGKESGVAITVLKMKNQIGGLQLRVFKIQYKATVNKRSCIGKRIKMLINGIEQRAQMNEDKYK